MRQNQKRSGKLAPTHSRAGSKMTMDESIGCSSGCGRRVEDLDEGLQKGWEFLPITQRYRCPQCYRDLKAVSERGKHND